MKEAFANCSEQQYYIKTTVRTRKHLAFSRIPATSITCGNY